MSETVTRYHMEWLINDAAFSSDMVRAPDGDWVAYTDYAALAQQLADVAYLEEWALAENKDREVWPIWADKRKKIAAAWVAKDYDSGVEATAPTFAALGALLRQREEGR